MGKALNIDWAIVELAYKRGEGSCRELGEKFGILPRTVTTRCAREGWVRQLKETESLVSQKMVETIANKRVKALESHHSLVVPIAEKLCKGVEKTFDDMHGEALEPNELQGLAMSLKTANSVALLNLGFVPQTSVDVTTGGESLHAHALSVLAACKRAVDSGAVDPKTLDVKGLLAEYKAEEEAKKLQ